MILYMHLSHMLSPSFYITGGSSGGAPKSKRQRPRRFHANEEGVLVDYGVTIQHRCDARAGERRAPAEKKKVAAAAMKNKGKEVRPNYNEIATPDYILIRRNDWYSEAERDDELDDRSFWCAEQGYIYKDVYTTLAKPIRPMAATDLDHLSRQEYFADAYNVLDQMGLLPLMTVQCDYNAHFILQFYSTVVFSTDVPMKIKWMTGLQYCESTWAGFAELLGYELNSGRRLHCVAADHNKNKIADLSYILYLLIGGIIRDTTLIHIIRIIKSIRSRING